MTTWRDKTLTIQVRLWLVHSKKKKEVPLTFWEDFGLESLPKKQVFQIIEGLRKMLRKNSFTQVLSKGEQNCRGTTAKNLTKKSDVCIQLQRGYSEGADEEDWSEETPQDGEPLRWSQLFTEHLHASKDQHWQKTRQHQGGSCVDCCKAKRERQAGRGRGRQREIFDHDYTWGCRHVGSLSTFSKQLWHLVVILAYRPLKRGISG